MYLLIPNFRLMLQISRLRKSKKAKTDVNVHLAGKNKFHCDKCNKVFTRKDNLARHSALHSGNVKVFCKVCGKGFFRKEHYDVQYKESRLLRSFMQFQTNEVSHV